jgi:hypothetical protein
MRNIEVGCWQVLEELNDRIKMFGVLTLIQIKSELRDKETRKNIQEKGADDTRDIQNKSG